jgi:hypothetical protein
LPGVTSVSVTSSLPLSGSGPSTSLIVEGRKIEPPMGLIHSVGANYFRTLAIPLLKGRAFTPRDDLKAPPVLIVNETLAKRLFPNEDPLANASSQVSQRLAQPGCARLSAASATPGIWGRAMKPRWRYISPRRSCRLKRWLSSCAQAATRTD